MAITKAQKQKIIEDLKEKIAKQKAMIFADFTGLKVKDFSELRKRIKAVEGEIKVAKKTLLNLAFKEKNLKFEKEKLLGEIAVIFGFKDEILPAKTVYQFTQENEKLKILGGFIGNEIFTAENLIALAKLPSKDELLANLVGSISAPVSNFVYVLNANIKGLVYLLSAIKK